GAPERPETQRQRLHHIPGGLQVQDRPSSRGKRQVERHRPYAKETDGRVSPAHDPRAGAAERSTGGARGRGKGIGLQAGGQDAGGGQVKIQRRKKRFGAPQPTPPRGLIASGPGGQSARSPSHAVLAGAYKTSTRGWSRAAALEAAPQPDVSGPPRSIQMVELRMPRCR